MDNNILIDWIKEANSQFIETRNHIDTKVNQLEEKLTYQHKELSTAVQENREEFVIFKTRVNTRVAVISSTISVVALVLSIILNLGLLKEFRKESNHDISNKSKTEITKNQ